MSAKLVKLAKAAAVAHGKASKANKKWVDAFREKYGHDDISDPLVEAIDYSNGNSDTLTMGFIEINSKPGES